MGKITRSTGIPIGNGAVCYGMAGGGYAGITRELDDVVKEAARALAGAYRMDITIRFNSDRASGGAWLVTHERDDIGSNAEIGIGGGVVTARARACWERWAREARDYPEERQHWEKALRDNPEGLLWVHAHITATSADPRRLRELRALPGWMDMGGGPGGYHHGEAGSVGEALQRCLDFAPPGTIHRR
jgi:hypothetical protein